MKDKNYKEIAQRMEEDAFHRGCYLSVLVEDIYDERFWQCIIENVRQNLTDKIDFPNPTSHGTRGKDILKKFEDFVNKKLIICIDSDCEYLYNNEEELWYCCNYIYHTVIYSKENFQCNHFSLNEICKDLTTKSYDFKELFKNISLKISPLFDVWLYFKEIQDNRFITNKTFRDILCLEGTGFDNIGDENILYQSIKNRVKSELQTIKNSLGNDDWYNSIVTNDIPDIKKRLKEGNLFPEEHEIISFCYGHAVLEEFVEPLMANLIESLKNIKLEESKQNLCEASDKDLKNTSRRIEKLARQDIKTKLNDSYKYLIYATADNEQMKKIKERLDIELIAIELYP
jgi:hypothetical protein